MSKFAVILPAAGRSTRFGAGPEKKTYIELAGRALWQRSAEAFVNRDDVGQVIVAIAPEDRELFEIRFRPFVAFLAITVVEGGAERHDTVANALAAIRDDCDHVAVHDAARPCITQPLIDAVFAAAVEHGAALPGLPVTDTLKRVDDRGFAAETVPRNGLVAVQTPQAFRRELLERAHANRPNLKAVVTDDAQLVEALGHPCRIVPGEPTNIKITTRPDLIVAEAFLRHFEELRAQGSGGGRPFDDERAMW